MKLIQPTALLFLLAILSFSTSSIAQDSPLGGNLPQAGELLPPQTTITVAQARANRDRFLANTDIDHSAFTYDFEELKKFIAFIEDQKAKGVDVKYITVYLSQYENGDKTAFIAPLKEDGTPNYDLKVLNHGNVEPPRMEGRNLLNEVRF